MKKNEFKNWLLSKTGNPFPDEPLFDACLSEAIELFNNSKFDNIPMADHLSPDEQLEYVSRTFQSNAKALLLHAAQSPNIVFRGVRLAYYSHDKDKWLLQLSQLNVEG